MTSMVHLEMNFLGPNTVNSIEERDASARKRPCVLPSPANFAHVPSADTRRI